ncbi:MAG: neutral/alkaline non-lysosomal ceramidase N-terminal domain-containing protein [Rhodopirellula sp.]|nr:neutral/alkaline non-lysosomal ceramidase N-terminal domain-containing protein [Rhodopirellula sp.]
MTQDHRRLPGFPVALAASVLLAAHLANAVSGFAADDLRPTLRVGVAETDITPPVGFPMAGYYHERLAEGSVDPLKAKAIVIRDGETAAALVVCDLIGIATDLSREVRQRAAEKTGIPAANIVISATHSHTAPDYMKELWLLLGDAPQEKLRADYIRKLIDGPVAAIVQASAGARPSELLSGAVKQTTPVAFNRRFVMRDGSVRTWQNHRNPEVVRAAGPIDPEIGLLVVRDAEGQTTRGVLSNFALHLDTVGGMRWSADYPFFIEQTLRKAIGPEVISLFGTGCCGDINHSDPSRPERNKVDFIGRSLGATIRDGLQQLQPVASPRLTVSSATVQLPLQEARREEVERAVQILSLARQGQKVDFFDHVTAYKKLILDQLRHREPYVTTSDHITWGLSRSLAGTGETLPVDVTAITIGRDVAIVCLPGEVFVELGLAIKQASPFRTTLVIELSNAVETIYIPHRAAYVGGSYEVTNSALMPGGGELLVEAALSLLRDAATGPPQP